MIKNKINKGSVIVTDCGSAFFDVEDKNADHGMAEYNFTHRTVNHSGQLDKEKICVSYGMFNITFSMFDSELAFHFNWDRIQRRLSIFKNTSNKKGEDTTNEIEGSFGRYKQWRGKRKQLMKSEELFRNWTAFYLIKTNLTNMRECGIILTLLYILHESLDRWHGWFAPERAHGGRVFKTFREN